MSELVFETLQEEPTDPAVAALNEAAIDLYFGEIGLPPATWVDSYMFAVTRGGLLCAVANLDMSPDCPPAHVLGLATAPNCRKQGIGTFMLSKIGEFVVVRGGNAMEATPKTHISQRLVSGAGFTPVAPRATKWRRNLTPHHPGE